MPKTSILQDQLEKEVAEKETPVAQVAAPAADPVPELTPAEMPMTVAPVIPQTPIPTESVIPVQRSAFSVQAMPVTPNQLLNADSIRTKQYLESQPKEAFYIPVASNEKAGVAEIPVTINGYTVNYKKGVRYMMPVDHIKTLMSHLRMDNGGDSVRIDRDEAHIAALTGR